MAAKEFATPRTSMLGSSVGFENYNEIISLRSACSYKNVVF